jgi:hypothetical protein
MSASNINYGFSSGASGPAFYPVFVGRAIFHHQILIMENAVPFFPISARIPVR